MARYRDSETMISPSRIFLRAVIAYHILETAFLCYFAGAAVPSDHLDTEISNSVMGCGEY